MGSRNGHWAGNGNLILGTGKWAGKWKFLYWASTGVGGQSVVNSDQEGAKAYDANSPGERVNVID